MSDKTYVMRYPDGKWVQRDDSTGPMSSGGYPMRVSELRRATQWSDIEEALKYRHMFKSEGWTLHLLTFSTAEITITPLMEAKASGDDEYLEYLRLKRKFGEVDEQCPFDRAWIGKCKKTPEVGEIFCPEHADMKCGQCGAQATRDCAATIGAFVCGGPLCAEHSHQH